MTDACSNCHRRFYRPQTSQDKSPNITNNSRNIVSTKIQMGRTFSLLRPNKGGAEYFNERSYQGPYNTNNENWFLRGINVVTHAAGAS